MADRITAEELRTLVDYDPLTGHFTWLVHRGRVTAGSPAGCRRPDGYVDIGIKGRSYKASNLAWLYVYGEWPAGEVDHKNRVRHENQIENLRPATHSENMANATRRKDNVSGFKGVSWHPEGRRWVAHITKDSKQYHLGLFDTPEDAHQAYLARADLFFGEFRRAA